ncbi:MAG: DUF2779 domain-containing protein [Nitrospirae bacterium]|nr:DUF2779 domain-containing protein [Nitrospirota bacterium]
MPTLSKTRFIEGLQCAKRLYLSTYHPELGEYTEAALSAFDEGKEVGLLATRLFTGGVRVEAEERDLGPALEQTAAFLADAATPAIFEATLSHAQVLVRVDILERISPEAWRIVEVKASTAVKDPHLPDTAIQYYVARGAGLAVESVQLMHLNSRYVYDGCRLDLSQLFTREDVTIPVRERQDLLPRLLIEQLTLLEGGTPEVEPGPHCATPYPCPFWSHCTAAKPKDWIYYLPRRNEVYGALSSRGVEGIGQIPEDIPLTRIQQRAKACVLAGDAYCDLALRGELRIDRYPVYYLDFETVDPAIPRYAGTRPYQPIPFQWSVQIVREAGVESEEQAYLHEGATDPRRALATGLLEVLREPGPIYVYNKSFEAEVLRQLAEYLPDLAHGLLALVEWLVDLLPPIRRHYYHPDQRGSFSLKAVAPTLAPELSYADLVIQEGSQAGPAFQRMIDPACPPEERARLRRALLAYCRLDTLALYKIHQRLLVLSGGS